MFLFLFLSIIIIIIIKTFSLVLSNTDTLCAAVENGSRHTPILVDMSLVFMVGTIYLHSGFGGHNLRCVTQVLRILQIPFMLMYYLIKNIFSYYLILFYIFCTLNITLMAFFTVGSSHRRGKEIQ